MDSANQIIKLFKCSIATTSALVVGAFIVVFLPGIELSGGRRSKPDVPQLNTVSSIINHTMFLMDFDKRILIYSCFPVEYERIARLWAGTKVNRRAAY